MDPDKTEMQDSVDAFYNCYKAYMLNANELLNLRYITSRSTEESLSHIQMIFERIDSACKKCGIPTEGIFLKKTELSVKAFKYLICNANFDCQKLLSNDTVCGHLVNLHPPFSLYLLVEIVWHLHFDDILAECMLHFPLDLCIEISGILPRCIDLLDFKRAVKFLTTFVQNIYKRLISIENEGSQTQNLNSKVKKLVENLQELLLQFENKKVFKSTDGSAKAEDRYKRCGILLKKIIQMVKICFGYKCKKFEIPMEMQKLYKLTFGDVPLQKIDPVLLDQFLTEINQGLIRLLLKKVKDIDCNIYINWTEYDDEDNTSLCLQRAIGLECYNFIESTKEFIDCDNKDFIHLTDCLEQLVSYPDPNSSVESLQLIDLYQGAVEGKKDCLIALFKRYKEWDSSISDSIDDIVFLLDSEVCEQLFDHLAMELSITYDPLDFKKLQLYINTLAHGFLFLKITDSYVMTVRFFLKFGENTEYANEIDISDFEKFIIHNTNFSTEESLKIVLFHLCLNAVPTLKVLLKIAIGHSDYPDVAISIDDIMLLIPFLKIQTESVIETLRAKYDEKREGFTCNRSSITNASRDEKKEPDSVTLAVKVLQDICMEGPKWNPNKFRDLLQAICGFCTVEEVVTEIFTPILMMDFCPLTYLKFILVELHKIIVNGNDASINDASMHFFNKRRKYDSDIVRSLDKQGVELLNSNQISRYIVDELLTLIIQLIKTFYNIRYDIDRSDKSYNSAQIFLHDAKTQYILFHQMKIECNLLSYCSHLNEDVTSRHFFLKCTKKQFLECLKNALCGCIVFKNLNVQKIGKAGICDNVIRLILENCLLCLEYPQVAPPDSISFLLRHLIELLPLITVSTKKTKLTGVICRNLNTHLAILKPSITYTAISEAYNDLVRRCEESNKLPECLAAMEQFASNCSKESEKLKFFRGPNSPMGIKLWLMYDIVEAVLDQSVSMEKYFMKLDEFIRNFDKSMIVTQ